MSKTKTLHQCSSCGASTAQWVGRCPTCGEWNTLEKQVVTSNAARSVAPAGINVPVSLSSVATETATARPTGIRELDRVLGGGLTPGSVTLLGGEPGIGKSTLVLQLCSSLASSGLRSLVVTGEESTQQVARRAERLGVAVDDVLLMAEVDVDTILRTVEDVEPQLLVIDSVQTMSSSGVDSAPGSVSQVRGMRPCLRLTGEAVRRCRAVGGPCHQRRNACGPACSRARRRYCARVRG